MLRARSSASSPWPESSNPSGRSGANVRSSASVVVTGSASMTFARRSFGFHRDGDSWTVAFTMPDGETLGTLPAPEDSRVVLREVPPARVAVVRFSGRWTDANIKEHEAELRRWTSDRRLTVIGEAEVSRYDPPFKPWFLRRNEVWFPLAEGDKKTDRQP